MTQRFLLFYKKKDEDDADSVLSPSACLACLRLRGVAASPLTSVHFRPCRGGVAATYHDVGSGVAALFSCGAVSPRFHLTLVPCPPFPLQPLPASLLFLATLIPP